ncbi:hypothetical protein OCGS_0878 [Oceaniovalibus guishaninsula JLT2003]|uniref:Uncharacterized protein n=1 Tax=Oceaniovalibus guishaninsula JLT2003 TaxID=1231392 RepID=K2HCQ9_9RHOB|nr:ankyrin repeat domain-containing protein [Oceaniovalibus guishaninsula]EKE45183.1 hypothetical protein OCGS_0878 [Oceaniovalibus guishaninsula JLT2003]
MFRNARRKSVQQFSTAEPSASAEYRKKSHAYLCVETSRYFFRKLSSAIVLTFALIIIAAAEPSNAQDTTAEDVASAILNNEIDRSASLLTQNQGILNGAEILLAIEAGVRTGDYTILQKILQAADLESESAFIAAFVAGQTVNVDAIREIALRNDGLMNNVMLEAVLGLRVHPEQSQPYLKVAILERLGQLGINMENITSDFISADEVAQAESWGILGPIMEQPVVSGFDDPVLVALRILVEMGADIESPHLSGDRTALQLAIDVGDPVLVHEIIRLGAAPGDSSLPVMFDLLVSMARNEQWQRFDILYSENDLPDDIIRGPDSEGRYLLPYLIRRSAGDRAIWLLGKRELPASAIGSGQERPITAAARLGDVELVSALVARGADPRKTDHDWPLRAAARAYHSQAMLRLVAAGADVNAVDPQGRSFLHGFVLASDGYEEPINFADLRAVLPEVDGIVAAAFAAGLNLDLKDAMGRTILHTAFGIAIKEGQYGFLSVPGTPDEERIFEAERLIRSLVRYGAKIDDRAIEKAFSIGSSKTLDLLLELGGSLDVEIDGSPMLHYVLTTETNFDTFWLNPALSHVLGLASLIDAEMALVLVSHGAPTPPVGAGAQTYLLNAAASGNPKLLKALHKTGYSHDGIQDTLMEIALFNGDSAMVEALVGSGVDPSHVGTKFSRSTALHHLVEADTRQTGNRRPILGSRQQSAVTRLLELGFDMGLRDRSGNTVLDLAGANGRTQAALIEAIANVDKPLPPLHVAVQEHDMVRLQALLDASEKNIDGLDGLGRTALTLALQKGFQEEAILLLRRGAGVALAPRNAYQLSDLNYATDNATANAFLVNMLQRRFVRRGDGTALNAPQTVIDAYGAARSFALPELRWAVTCEKRCTPALDEIPASGIMSESEILSLPIIAGIRFVSRANDDVNIRTYSLSGYWIDHVQLSDIYTATEVGASPVLLSARGNLTIPSCSFDFVTDMVCSPQLTVRNLTRLPKDGQEGSLFRGPVPILVRQGTQSYPLRAGEFHVFDRSEGVLEIVVGPFTTKEFSIEFAVETDPGERFDLKSGFGARERLDAYAQLRTLFDRLEQLDPSNGAAVKSTAAAMNALSAYIAREKYLENAVARTRELANDIAGLDQSVRLVREQIQAGSTASAEDVHFIIALIDEMLEAAAGNREVFDYMRERLLAVARSLEAGSAATADLREQLFTEVDRKILLYQVYALEVAQFVGPDLLSETLKLPEATLAGIQQNTGAGDRWISRTAMNGTGDALISTIGLN